MESPLDKHNENPYILYSYVIMFSAISSLVFPVNESNILNALPREVNTLSSLAVPYICVLNIVLLAITKAYDTVSKTKIHSRFILSVVGFILTATISKYLFLFLVPFMLVTIAKTIVLIQKRNKLMRVYGENIFNRTQRTHREGSEYNKAM